MNLVLFIIVVAVSFIAVRIGAVAFQLTGLEWSLAKFQALSCFTGTGFTTREAELVTGNYQRRRIASVLMVLGNAGFVTMIATFANSIRPTVIATKIAPSFLPEFMRPYMFPWLNLLVIVAALYTVFKLFTHSGFTKKLTNTLRQKLAARDAFSRVSFEELLMIAGGYGVSRIDISKDDPVAGKTLSESGLRKKDITVLAILRSGQTIPNPFASNKIQPGDELISFGRIESIRELTGSRRGRKRGH